LVIWPRISCSVNSFDPTTNDAPDKSPPAPLVVSTPAVVLAGADVSGSSVLLDSPPPQAARMSNIPPKRAKRRFA